MSGLEKILGEINAESDGLAKEILDKATAEAKKIKAEAEKNADDSCERLRRESNTRLADLKSRAQSAASLARRQMLLAEKQDLISGVLEKAKGALSTLPDNEYFEFIQRLVAKNVLAQDGTIIFNKKDRDRLPANFSQIIATEAMQKGGSLKVSDETRDIDGGFVLSYGGVEQNCSISSLFETNIDALQDKVQELLFK